MQKKRTGRARKKQVNEERERQEEKQEREKKSVFRLMITILN